MYQIGVIGSAGPEEYPGKSNKEKVYRFSWEVGKLLTEKGCLVITGGKGGVMQAASFGAKKAGGLTVGIVKGSKRRTANKYIDVELVANTSWGGEESLLVTTCDGFIVIGGGAGTLQEMCAAYRCKKPIVAIVGVKGYSSVFAGKYLDERRLVKIRRADSPEKAVTLLLKLLR